MVQPKKQPEFIEKEKTTKELTDNVKENANITIPKEKEIINKSNYSDYYNQKLE